MKQLKLYHYPCFRNTAEHSFHRLESEHSFSASNVFKLDPLHAIFALKQHDPIHWSQEEFMDLAHLTVKWLVNILLYIFYAHFYINCYTLPSRLKICLTVIIFKISFHPTHN